MSGVFVCYGWSLSLNTQLNCYPKDENMFVKRLFVLKRTQELVNIVLFFIRLSFFQEASKYNYLTSSRD